MNLGSQGCSELRTCHCIPAWETGETVSKKKEKKRERKKEGGKEEEEGRKKKKRKIRAGRSGSNL